MICNIYMPIVHMAANKSKNEEKSIFKNMFNPTQPVDIKSKLIKKKA